MSTSDGAECIPVLYLAPWVDYGGSDKGTIDWFRWLDRNRFAPSLITTQPSHNRRLHDVYPFAREVWALPEHMAGHQFPRFIFDFIHTRGIRLLQIMNSRIAFDLLPDLAALDRPPAVVVQLHVEEPDRGGYVRYVTTRYGNLVDAFVVTSEHLAQAVQGYDVPASKIHVIPTGVDAELEFNPQRVRPLERERARGAFTILFAGRLEDQKDPLLMIDVVDHLVARHRDVRVEVIGEGPLEPTVRARVGELGLNRHVRIHPPTSEFASWLRSCDLLLMTSTFEGVPYVIYEAMAMGVPVVAPSLPGNVELMDGTGGILVDPRDDAAAYAAAVSRLIEDHELRAELGRSGRARMLDEYGPRKMAFRHEVIYDGLLSSRPAAALAEGPPPPVPIRLCDRPIRGTPLVSIVTPCFNHGRYLRSFLDGIEAQDYPAIEVIIIDDASTDPETVEKLARIEEQGRARVLQQERNSGPSAARNRAVAAAQGRYILPVDADNILLPGAVRGLVEQLQAAAERVGFIYPSFQYFGTRDYCFEAPAYNLFALLQGNYADTCSLLDRAIFDAGFRYGEDIQLGHEDWDLALALGARDVIGEPSRKPVMLYRKQGFTRSDAVEHLRLPFSQEIQERRPELFGSPSDVGAWGRYRGPSMRIKARWSPALSIMCAGAVDFDAEEGLALLRALASQSCRDFELIAECPRRPQLEDLIVRRIPPGLSASVPARLQESLDVSRGRYLLLALSPTELFADPTVVEKLLRGFGIDAELSAVAIADVGAAGRFPLSFVEQSDSEPVAHAVAWKRELHGVLDTVEFEPGRETECLVDVLQACEARTQWRHFPAGAKPSGESGCPQPVLFERWWNASSRSAERRELQQRLKTAPVIPGIRPDQVPRWTLSHAWMPPETLPLVRHVHVASGRRVVTNDRAPAPGYKIEFDLGSLHKHSPPGTVRLVRRDGHFVTVPRGSERPDEDQELGHLEEVPLPLLLGIERAVLADGSETLVMASERDPARVEAQVLTLLGFIEGFPNEPVHLSARTGEFVYERGPQPSLVRTLDRISRRHRYSAVFSLASLDSAGRLSAELGTLSRVRGPTSIPLFVDASGQLSTDRYSPDDPSPGVPQLLRWSLAPVTWREAANRKARTRAVVRRTLDSLQIAAGAGTGAHNGSPASLAEGTEGGRQLLGYLYREPGPGRIELFAARHVVMPDQFLTHHPIEATDMGYERPCSLGYVVAAAPLTGQLGGRRAGIPWASRFGLDARTGGGIRPKHRRA